MIWSSEKSLSARPQADRPCVFHPVLAYRAVESAILCGMCNHPIAERLCGVLHFPADSSGCERWKGWRLSPNQADGAPGGVWKVAEPLQAAQPSICDRLELLPAIVECPYCTVPNLFDPTRLNVRPDQLAARADRIRRQSHADDFVPRIGSLTL